MKKTLEEIIEKYEKAVVNNKKYINYIVDNDLLDKIRVMPTLTLIEEYQQIVDYLKRLKRIEDYIADDPDDYSLDFIDIRAVLNGEFED